MKTIDAVLLEHKNQTATTMCELLLVGPLPDGTYRGFAGLDEDVTFEPAASIGPITFKASTGVQMSAIEFSADLAVDNAEAETLYPIAGYELDGFTQQEIDAGLLDAVRFLALQVNYNDLTAGRCEILHGGTIGEVRAKAGRMTIPELRSLSQQMKQQIIQTDSLRCRARFGSQPIGTGGGVIEERFPCGYDTSMEWISSAIDSVGSEPDLVFVDATLIGSGDNYFAPGMFQVLSGDNEGQMVEVEAFDNSTGTVTLRFPVATVLEAGVLYRMRRHCTKRWTGHNSCETFWASDKPLHFRGEPWIPVGNAGLLNTPGAAMPRGSGGTGE